MVGLTEEEAGKRGLKVRCGHFSMEENGRSIISGEQDGFIRLVFEAYSNTIVGAQMMCPRANGYDLGNCHCNRKWTDSRADVICNAGPTDV